MPLKWQQENPIEGTMGARAVIDTEELKAPSPLDLQVLDWRHHLTFPGAGAVWKVTYVHYPVVSTVKTRVPEGSVCTRMSLVSFCKSARAFP